MTVATPAKNLVETSADIVDSVEAGERVVLTHKGAPVAAVVSLEDLHRLEAIEAEEDRIDVETVRQFDADVAAGREQPVPWEQVKRNLGL